MNGYSALNSVKLFAVVLLLIFAACSSKSNQIDYSIVADGKYDSEFPTQSTSEWIEEIANTVKRISAIAFYEGYTFSPDSNVTLSDIENGMAERKAERKILYNHPAIGSATIIFQKGKRIIVLTCAHVVNFPDTIITYYKSDTSTISQFIESFSVKTKQKNQLVDIVDGADFEILAMDSEGDLALLQKDFLFPPASEIPVFTYKIGNATELKWGTFVYLIGWPKGNHKMVTSGLVSSPNRDKNHSFLIDASFNRGFSGGIVLATRDGIPNFELVGIVSSASASFEHVLVPEKNVDITRFDPFLPYSGQTYVRLEKEIDYGITFGISSESIQDFLKRNQKRIESRGYNISDFFYKDIK
jgi:hypothetical protein